ncbi:MAG TPA: tRNA 2-thiocytidine(32) synthetase TtcA [Polyangia bacterium]|nr:tRNA 2-thiocytidine(32) synthetase TtcA [Polyangia bacterium]
MSDDPLANALPVALPVHLERRLTRDMGRALMDFHLLQEGDRLLVAMSGGKDSYAMCVLLRDLQKRAPIRFELVAVHIDQGHPGYDGAPLEAWLRAEGIPHRIIHEDTYSIVTDKIPEGKTYCSLCSRLRRGILYEAATELGCNKIALGHHRDDALETLMLNLFFGGKLATMPPRLVSDDGRHVVIRPLIYCAEPTLAAFAKERAFPILPCNLCGSQSEAQRKQMKALLGELEAKHPTLRQTMLAALGNVNPSHLFDKKLFPTHDAPSAREGDVESGIIAASALLRATS